MNVLAIHPPATSPQLPRIGRQIQSALASGREFALYWRGGNEPCWFTSGPKGARCFVAWSFSARPGTGLWAGWPAGRRLVECSPPSCAAELGTFTVSGFLDEESQGHWLQRVERALEHVRRGAAQKVVLSRRRRAAWEGSVGRAVAHLGAPSTREALILWHRPGQGTFLARSPEQLLAVRGGACFVDALAGTSDLSSTLLNSEKDRREQAHVADDVRTVLTRYCQVLDEAPVRAVRAGSLFHLLSSFQGTLHRGVAPLDVVRALHPTPAVGTVPREAASLLRDLEPLERGYYAAPLGIVEHGAADVSVGLRCALLRDGLVTVFGGAGIVDGSSPLAEWHETANKMRVLEDAWTKR